MSTPDIIVDINNLRRTYQVGDEEVVAVKDVTLTIPSGRFIAVVGRSGSGKTTLLNLVAGLDKPTSGTILFQGNDISEMNEKELTEIRRHKGGFVFQAFVYCLYYRPLRMLSFHYAYLVLAYGNGKNAQGKHLVLLV